MLAEVDSLGVSRSAQIRLSDSSCGVPVGLSFGSGM